MKTYVLTISTVFPTYHKKSGNPTNFIDKLLSREKRHTIRSNYELWSKRIEKVNKGEALISVRYWSGKPYNSKQIELAKVYKARVEHFPIYNSFNQYYAIIEQTKVDWGTLAKNDGLSYNDFKEWFKKWDHKEPLVVIHFGDYGYATKNI